VEGALGSERCPPGRRGESTPSASEPQGGEEKPRRRLAPRHGLGRSGSDDAAGATLCGDAAGRLHLVAVRGTASAVCRQGTHSLVTRVARVARAPDTAGHTQEGNPLVARQTVARAADAVVVALRAVRRAGPAVLCGGRRATVWGRGRATVRSEGWAAIRACRWAPLAVIGGATLPDCRRATLGTS